MLLTAAVLGALPRAKALLRAPELAQLKGQGMEMETCPKKEEFPGVGSGDCSSRAVYTRRSSSQITPSRAMAGFTAWSFSDLLAIT